VCYIKEGSSFSQYDSIFITKEKRQQTEDIDLECRVSNKSPAHVKPVLSCRNSEISSTMG
jgi:hypothetical protein